MFPSARRLTCLLLVLLQLPAGAVAQRAQHGGRVGGASRPLRQHGDLLLQARDDVVGGGQALSQVLVGLTSSEVARSNAEEI